MRSGQPVFLPRGEPGVVPRDLNFRSLFRLVHFGNSSARTPGKGEKGGRTFAQMSPPEIDVQLFFLYDSCDEIKIIELGLGDEDGLVFRYAGPAAADGLLVHVVCAGGRWSDVSLCRASAHVNWKGVK